MPDAISSTVIVAALTSATVALGIEYVAKPRLEARKERLLAAHRARSTITRCLLRILVSSTKLRAESPPALPAGPRKIWLDEITSAKEAIVTTSRELEQAVFDAGIGFERMVVILTRFAIQSRLVVLSDRSNHKRADLILASGAPLLSAWRASMRPLGGLRIIHGGIKLMAAEKELDRVIGDDHPSATGSDATTRSTEPA